VACFSGLRHFGKKRAMKENTKRAAILKAGSACFTRFGYDKTNLDDIGKQAGLNKASLYYYFKNKEEIFVAVIFQETEAFAQDLQSKTEALTDVRQQIVFYLTERIRRYGEVLLLTQLSVENLRKLEPQFDVLYKETKTQELHFLTELLQKAALQKALLLEETPAQLAEHLFYLSDALKQAVVQQKGHFASAGTLDFSPAIAEMEFWVNLILR
jgi:AcrR family transcriptional regulator